MTDRISDVRFEHVIIPATDKHRSASYFTEIFGLRTPEETGPFMQFRLGDGRLLDYADFAPGFPGQHYAFLVDDATFDAIVNRIHSRGIDHWADPFQHRPNEINISYGGRGVYFCNPDGHVLEAITKRYDASPLT